MFGGDAAVKRGVVGGEDGVGVGGAVSGGVGRGIVVGTGGTGGAGGSSGAGRRMGEVRGVGYDFETDMVAQARVLEREREWESE